MLANFKKCFYLFSLFLSTPAIALAFDSFDCVGTEPFWKLSVAEHKFTFKEKAIISSMPAVAAKPSENMGLDHIRVFRTKLNNKEAVIIIQKQSCTDGMSEDVFEYEGLFITTDKVYHGCCSKKLLLTH